jgi:hypothetical protein
MAGEASARDPQTSHVDTPWRRGGAPPDCDFTHRPDLEYRGRGRRYGGIAVRLAVSAAHGLVAAVASASAPGVRRRDRAGSAACPVCRRHGERLNRHAVVGAGSRGSSGRRRSRPWTRPWQTRPGTPVGAAAQPVDATTAAACRKHAASANACDGIAAGDACPRGSGRAGSGRAGSGRGDSDRADAGAGRANPGIRHQAADQADAAVEATAVRSTARGRADDFSANLAAAASSRRGTSPTAASPTPGTSTSSRPCTRLDAGAARPATVSADRDSPERASAASPRETRRAAGRTQFVKAATACCRRSQTARTRTPLIPEWCQVLHCDTDRSSARLRGRRTLHRDTFFSA